MIFILDYKIYNPISFRCMKLEKGGFSDKYITRSPYLFFLTSMEEFILCFVLLTMIFYPFLGLL